MKKQLLFAVMALTLTAASAQSDGFYGIFNHFGGDINVGSQGIGFDLATPITQYLEVSAGMNFMPGFK